MYPEFDIWPSFGYMAFCFMDFSLIWTILAGTNVVHISGIGCIGITQLCLWIKAPLCIGCPLRAYRPSILPSFLPDQPQSTSPVPLPAAASIVSHAEWTPQTYTRDTVGQKSPKYDILWIGSSKSALDVYDQLYIDYLASR